MNDSFRLIGDLGGTKVLLGLLDQAGQITCQRRLASADFSCFEDLLANFLSEFPARVIGGCLAVAGPVEPDGLRAKVTNLPWRIDCEVLAARFAIGRLRLVNDFAAVAAGVDISPPAQQVVLQTGAADPAGLRLVLGAGTGLGVAALRGAGANLDILSGEGGHIAFAPQDETQDRLLAALRTEYGRVSVERLVSGGGLAAIHRILHGELLEPAGVAARALAGDADARASTDTFFAIYGAVAGDLALVFLARGGVCLAGGVTQRLLPLLADSPFRQAFNAKAEHAPLVGRMPVTVFTDPAIGLVGAAVLAGRKLC